MSFAHVGEGLDCAVPGLGWARIARHTTVAVAAAIGMLDALISGKVTSRLPDRTERSLVN
jgi:hypothetical protein